MTQLSPSKDTRTAKASHWLRQTNFQWSPTTLSFGEAGDRDWRCRLSARTCKLINDAPKYPDPTIRNNIAMCFAERALLARVPNYRPASLPTPMMAGARVPPVGSQACASPLVGSMRGELRLQFRECHLDPAPGSCGEARSIASL
jgi:hypothetical protein